jgi:diguanylate cyclase (GGDEF)-like protein
MRFELLPRVAGRLSLTRQVALLSLVPIVALGLILARVLQSQIQARALADATQSARLIANVAVQPKLSEHDLRSGLSAAEVRALDEQLGAPDVHRDLARIKIWSARDTVVYSDDHSIIGRTLPPSDDLEDALAGHPHEAAVVTPRPYSETSGEVGLGQLVEVYVPLRFAAKRPPAGAFEIYLSYRPIAAAISSDKRTIALLIAIGLALLWAILYRIVARASRRLRRQALDNHELARFDPLTGLPNRTLFLERVASALGDGAGHGASCAVLVIDLDRFGEVNNTLGSVNGDRVLCEVGRRLRDGLGEGTLVARLGADEYAVMCTRGGDAAGARETAARIHASLEAPIALADAALNVEASIGIAVAGQGAPDAHALLQRADVALSRARACASRIEVYSRERDSVDAEQLLLLGEVRDALARGAFELYYQPKLDLATRRICGVEALLRWRHEQRGLLSPMEFVPMIEQTALVGPVTLYVIERALEQLVSWRRLGVHIGMSVNLSARNLLDAQLPARVAEQLARHGVPGAMLTVEVTESAAMTDPARAVHVLEALRALGVRVSVDDFGTGNASIEYLVALPADELKIDRSFVTGMLSDPRAEAIVRATVDLARNLGLRVVAEGIETEEVLEHLASLRCDVAQGYLIARPMPPEELRTALAEAFRVGAAQLLDAGSEALA